MLTPSQIQTIAATAASRYLFDPQFAGQANSSPEPFRSMLHQAGCGWLDCEEHQESWDAVVEQLDRYVSGDDQMILSAARTPVVIGQQYSWCPWSPGNPIIRHGTAENFNEAGRVTMHLTKEWEVEEGKWLERLASPAVKRLYAVPAYQLFPVQPAQPLEAVLAVPPSVEIVKVPMPVMTRDGRKSYDGAESYACPDGSFTMRREVGMSPNGNEFNGGWVLRNANGEYVDHSRYRVDLAERHNIHIVP